MIGALTGMVEVDLVRGRPREASRASEEAQDYAAQGFSPDQRASLMIQLGRARAMAGDFAKAREILERGARAAARIAEHGDAAFGWIWLSELARRDGDHTKTQNQQKQTLEFIETKQARTDFGTC